MNFGSRDQGSSQVSELIVSLGPIYIHILELYRNNDEGIFNESLLVAFQAVK